MVRGRVVKGDPPSGRAHHHRFTKAASTAKAFLRGDVEGATIVVTDLQSGRRATAECDDEGFYEVTVPGPFALGPHTLRVDLDDPSYTTPAVEIPVIVVDAQAPGLIVVLDIDDTLVDTGVTRGLVRVAVGTALRDASDMIPYPQAADTVQAFAAAGAQLVYLSASPVELAPRLSQFLAFGGFPAAPLFLRYYRDDGVFSPGAYKRARLDRLLADFPGRKLVLVGDNGEEDATLFAQVAKDTGKVAAAYVRSTLSPGAALPAPLTAFSDWGQLARDAARHGLVRWMTGQRIYLASRGGGR